MTQSARNRPIHVEVKAKEREPSERLVHRFIKKCKKSKINEIFIKKCPGSATYIKKSDRKRHQKKKIELRIKKKQEKE